MQVRSDTDKFHALLARSNNSQQFLDIMPQEGTEKGGEMGKVLRSPQQKSRNTKEGPLERVMSHGGALLQYVCMVSSCGSEYVSLKMHQADHWLSDSY